MARLAGLSHAANGRHLAARFEIVVVDFSGPFVRASPVMSTR
jgi:hypothetical protein